MRIKKIRRKAKVVWEWLPKEAKVSLYMFGAIVLDQLAKDLTPETFSFIPMAYRITFFNLVEVVLVEMAKRLRTLRKK